MEKMKYYWGILLICLFIACSGNDDVDVIEPWEEEYTLPQGESDADSRIVDFYNQYGTYILYDYTYTDFRYEISSTMSVELPDPKYVGDMLDLLDDIWFDFYPAEFLKKTTPLKIMLAESIQYDIWPYFVLAGESCLAFGFCSDTLQKLTPATKVEFKDELQKTLWDYFIDIEYPDDFFAVSDYTYVANVDPASEDYARNRGFLANNNYEWSTSLNINTGMLSEETDITSFIAGMRTRTAKEWEDDLKWPLVKKKYDILRNWIQENYGFDIQKIGNATYE